MKKRAPISEVMWAVASIEGWLYVGTWLHRQDATEGHSSDIGRTWAECRKNGDRCVKVRVTEIVR